MPFKGIELPPYYADVMELSVSTDRGDVWYEFPYDEEGKARSQPVSRRPRLTIFVHYNDQKIPLARFGTTVGGWRGEFIEGAGDVEVQGLAGWQARVEPYLRCTDLGSA